MQNAASKANLKRAVNIPRFRVRQQAQLHVSRQHQMTTRPNSHIIAQEVIGQVIVLNLKIEIQQMLRPGPVSLPVRGACEVVHGG